MFEGSIIEYLFNRGRSKKKHIHFFVPESLFPNEEVNRPYSTEKNKIKNYLETITINHHHILSKKAYQTRTMGGHGDGHGRKSIHGPQSQFQY